MTYRIEITMYEVNYGHGEKYTWRSFKKRTQYLAQAIQRAKKMRAQGYEVEIVKVNEVHITESEVFLKDSDFAEE